MKPLHAAITRLSRCPCCQSNYTKNAGPICARAGKKAARLKAKNEIKKLLKE